MTVTTISIRRCIAIVSILLLVVACTAQQQHFQSSPTVIQGARSSPTRSEVGASISERSVPLIGAHYYLWYPTNFAQGTLRAHLRPPQAPDPATYDSASPATAERAIAAASAGGVNFFTLDWWPGHPELNRNVDTFLHAPNVGDIKFALLYETQALGFDAAHEATPATTSIATRFGQDMLSLARRYFSNPNYLRLHGRPVIVLYLTRTLTGDVARMINGARTLLAARGYDPYIIGDEIFWRVTAPRPPSQSATWLTRQPQPERIRLFDAVTAYCLYAGGSPGDPSPETDFQGYPGTSPVAADELALYRRYQKATNGAIPVIPDVCPGVNTRGVRLQQNQPAVPRQWLPGQDSASTLRHLLSDVALPSVDRRAPLVFVTSWNEWNEDTAIEPLPGQPTSLDDSPSGRAYTQGYTYGGEGDAALATIRDLTAVAWGMVTRQDGTPDAHAELLARTPNGTAVAITHTDSRGAFVLPRTAATSAALEITLTTGAESLTMTVRDSIAVHLNIRG